MDREDRCSRNYKTTALPTLKLSETDAAGPHDPETAALPKRGEVLMKLYDQTCQTWRELIGVRFKLLALVPAASILALGALFSSEGPGKGLSSSQRLVIAGVGLIVTLGLLVYDVRNSQFHNDLISRGRKIEDELGVDTGIFRGRLKTSGIVKHDVATALIYGASLFAWLTVIVANAVSALLAGR